MTNGGDWISIDNYTQPSFTVQDLGSNTCRYQYGFLYTIYYSYAVLEKNRHYYIKQILQSALTTTMQTSATSGATASFSLHHSFKYIYIPPEGVTTSAILSNTDKYGSGLSGLISRLFSETVFPLLQPSSVDSG